MISEKPPDFIDAAATGPRLGSDDLGFEAMGVEDRSFRGSRFADVEAALFENPYQRIWGCRRRAVAAHIQGSITEPPAWSRKRCACNAAER